MESVEEGSNHQGLTVDALGSQLLLPAEVVAVSSDRLRIGVGRTAVWLEPPQEVEPVGRLLAKRLRCVRGTKPFVSDNLPAVEECLLLDLAQRDDFARAVGQPQDFCNHEQRAGNLLQDATSCSLISAVAEVAQSLLQQRASTLAHQNTWAIEQSLKHGRTSERGRTKDGGSTMRTEVMWRPPGKERRKQRRSGAGRHITVLATQPTLCDGSHNCGHIDRSNQVKTLSARWYL